MVADKGGQSQVGALPGILGIRQMRAGHWAREGARKHAERGRQAVDARAWVHKHDCTAVCVDNGSRGTTKGPSEHGQYAEQTCRRAGIHFL